MHAAHHKRILKSSVTSIDNNEYFCYHNNIMTTIQIHIGFKQSNLVGIYIAMGQERLIINNTMYMVPTII